MATQQFDIATLFQPGSGAATTKRKDSGADISDATSQFSNFKGFSASKTPSKSPSVSSPQPVTLTFTPSTGSTCISLYPRTKTFTFSSPISSTSCLATCEKEDTWRISAVPSSPDSELQRFTFERVEGEDGEQVKEAFRRCSVVVPSQVQVIGQGRRQSSADLGRRLSVGHFSSGLSGFKLPYSPKV